MLNNKKNSFLTAIVLIGAGALIGAATTTLFTRTAEKEGIVLHHTFFALENTEFFPVNNVEISPGDSYQVNAVLTSRASVSMFAWVVVTMPSYAGTKGIYTLSPEPSNDWVFQEEWINADGKYCCAYRLAEPLEAEETTPALTTALQMRSMSLKDYGNIGNLNPKISGFGCGTDMDPDTGWSALKENYGL